MYKPVVRINQDHFDYALNFPCYLGLDLKPCPDFDVFNRVGLAIQHNPSLSKDISLNVGIFKTRAESSAPLACFRPSKTP
jgi:hypothetical protein